MKPPALLFAFRLSIVFIALLSVTSNAQCSFTLARLRYGGGGDWYNGATTLPNLITAIKQETTIPVCDTAAVVSVMDENLFRYPFLYMTGHGNIHFTPEERVRMRTFLCNGGFLLANDDYGLDTAFRREMLAMFPDNPLVEIPQSHPLYSCVHTLPGLPKIHEHDGKPAQGFGIFFNKRLIVYYAYSSDIGDGMEDTSVYHDGEQLHRLALNMGVNLVYWFFNP